MTIDDITKLHKALGHFDAAVEEREVWKAAHWDDERDEPTCGYREWDEAMYDWATAVAEAGEFFAEAVREVLG